MGSSPSLGDEESVPRPHFHRPAPLEHLLVARVPGEVRRCEVDRTAQNDPQHLRQQAIKVENMHAGSAPAKYPGLRKKL
jgi:hypothetical protein